MQITDRYIRVLCADLGFYALPAKEELSPMFPHNSSSHEISTETNAFVQNSMVSVYMFIASIWTNNFLYIILLYSHKPKMNVTETVEILDVNINCYFNV